MGAPFNNGFLANGISSPNGLATMNPLAAANNIAASTNIAAANSIAAANNIAATNNIAAANNIATANNLAVASTLAAAEAVTPCAANVLGYEPKLGGLRIGDIAASNSRGFQVTSSSPGAPHGLSVLSDNMVVEGPLTVAGQLPFLGSVALEGPLAATGQGAVSYGCGNGNVGIVNESAGPMGPTGGMPYGGLPMGPGYGGFPMGPNGIGFNSIGATVPKELPTAASRYSDDPTGRYLTTEAHIAHNRNLAYYDGAASDGHLSGHRYISGNPYTGTVGNGFAAENLVLGKPGISLATPLTGLPCGPIVAETPLTYAPGIIESFPLAITSRIPPGSLSVFSDNLVIEGPIIVNGELPFLASVAVQGQVPAVGRGTVSYGCGNGEIGITAEGVAPPASPFSYGNGFGYSSDFAFPSLGLGPYVRGCIP
ncbi:unnamed protein product, partial [Iphiclides podalirius]